MADWLLLRLPRTPAQPATWLVVDPRGTPAGPPQSGPLSLAAPRTAGRRICVLVPGNDVLLAEPEVPTKAGTKLAQVVPYALEEQLAEDIDELHFAIGKRAPDSSRTPVAVVARTLLDEWLTLLKSSGIEPEAMYADSDLLPVNPGQSVALLEEDVVVVRPPGGSPVTLPADALDEALEIAQSSPGEGGAGRGLLLYTGPAEWHQHAPRVEALRERFDGIKIQLLTGGPLSLFAQQLPLGSPINLLQGTYAPTTSRAVGWPAWRVAAILLAALVGLHVAGKAAELSMLKRSEHKLDASISDVFHAALPGQQTTADPRRRMEKQLADIAARGSAGGLLPALEALAQAHASAPMTAIQALNFHDGTLEMQLSAPDATTVDHVIQSLKGNGWQANQTSGNAAPSGYQGRIEIRPN
ncbi:MAG TPA: type II secretion system protein GspL [Steroidobacteraceae bacterium]|nr:type II secretion system protein GspL [Steroidobacteraceae bacterium]